MKVRVIQAWMCVCDNEERDQLLHRQFQFLSLSFTVVFLHSISLNMGNVLSRNGSLGSVLGKRAADHDDRDNVKRMKSEPTETDAGITAFVNPNLPGFHGIIKYRLVLAKKSKGLI